MKTRSQTRLETNYADKYEVIIDFDGASAAWKANKKATINGCYKYICLQKTRNGNDCKRESLPGCDCCKVHK